MKTTVSDTDIGEASNEAVDMESDEIETENTSSFSQSKEVILLFIRMVS